MNSNTLQNYCILLIENGDKPLADNNITGYNLDICKTLFDGRASLEKSPEKFSLIILAEDLPEDNIDLFIEWLAISYPQLPLILITTCTDNKVLAKYLNSGVAAFLQKPYTKDSLLEVCNNVLSNADKTDYAYKGSIDAEIFTDDWVELSANSEIEFLSRIQRFSEILLKKHLPENMVEDIKLAIEEYGRNAIEWGNKFDSTKKFNISYCVFTDRIVLKFEDEGEGFDLKKLPDPTLDPIKHLQNREEAGKRPGGYGIYMMKNIMDEVFYNAKGNICIMTKFLK